MRPPPIRSYCIWRNCKIYHFTTIKWCPWPWLYLEINWCRSLIETNLCYTKNYCESFNKPFSDVIGQSNPTIDNFIYARKQLCPFLEFCREHVIHWNKSNGVGSIQKYLYLAKLRPKMACMPIIANWAYVFWP